MIDREPDARERLLDRSLSEDVVRRDTDPAIGSPTALARTTMIVTYPTTAHCYYACQMLNLLGTEVEGSPGVLTESDALYLALNLGGGVPPPGTTVLTTFVGNRWVFRYD
ncbi:MAG TPA: hypothetical protein VLM40_17220 [Gemmata sp.]|nr:hypothetical protein [Gemmata sp.]